ncbi:hypothetical protein HPP92_004161 [Vanilla planifolia]|uniref:Uncharacterized protein n=1 Tax=Vanilla planifolia TaxID=51239 RepID=A0A835S9B8_VANPL|nr:hypothetical protein HPP92_004598 [Vanilla planifolia]KAG0504089.1 hypothetical protein HPP92_004161 [Vanilla planifolia]
MPPSPAVRCSPTWEYSAENSHKRGHSFESGLNLKNKDDDLLLFNEMQNRERDKFLLHTDDDDFEDSLSKLKHFSDFKLGINILMSQKERLLTPPDTPLFPSLDDSDSQQVNIESRGMPRSQPIPISRSFVGKPYQTSRTSSSPHRLSPSPRSGGIAKQMKGTASSALRSSPPPVFRSTTPTRRSSTPSNKTSSPTRRPSTLVNKPSSPTTCSSTPTLRRMSTSSSNYQSANIGVRGASPVKANRGSFSPKLQAWQTTLSGFTSEVPPNLRTSLSDRSMSYTRGSSPSSRNGRESPVGLRRKSMSPTSSRSISSSHSQDRDHFSCYSRSSMVSSGEDDEDSLHSIPGGLSRSPPVRKNVALANSKSSPFSRKPYRTSSSNSVPKRSFESTLRLMDTHKAPQNMFRPLLSSVPATTFRPMFSRNSSLTTSSNASSDHGIVNVNPDLQGSELGQSGLSGGWERSEGSDTHEEVFMFDRIDNIVEHTIHTVHPAKPQCGEDYGKSLSKKLVSEDIQNSVLTIGDATISATVVSAQFTNNQFDNEGYAIMAVCSKCGKEFEIVDESENRSICKDCAEQDGICSRAISFTCMPVNKNDALSKKNNKVDTSSNESILNSVVSDFHEETNGKVLLGQHEWSTESGVDCLPNISIQLVEQRELCLSNQHLDRKMDMKVTEDGSMLHLSTVVNNPSLKVDIPEGTGTSVLLQRSGSIKWPILQGRTLSCANILSSEPSYSRDNTIALRRSHGRDSISASSSIDLGTSKQSESYVQLQLSIRSESDSVTNDINSNMQSLNSDYDVSIHSYEPRKLKMELEEKYSNSMECPADGSLREIILFTEETDNSIDQSDPSTISSSSRPFISENCISEHDNCRTVSSSEQRILNNQENAGVSCSSASEIKFVEDCISSTGENVQNNGRYTQNRELKTDISGGSEMEEDYAMANCSFQNGATVATTNCSSIAVIESQDGEVEGFQTDCRLLDNPTNPKSSNIHSISQTQDHDISLPSSDPLTAIHEHVNPEQSAITIEAPREMSRSLTLEEATDTILFCSSIIHDLAYKAVVVAMENESEVHPDPPFRSAMTTLGKPIPGLRDPIKMPNKHLPRLQQSKRKRLETPIRSPPEDAGENAIVQELLDSSVEITRKVDTAKPPKLESKCNCTVM